MRKIIQQFELGTKILLNRGSLESLKDVKGTKTLIVADTMMEQLGYVDEIKKYLAEKNRIIKVFTGVSPNPDTKVIAEGVRMYREIKPDTIVAIGGGSVIDAAKGIFYAATKMTEESLAKPYFIAIPTTSGTGSEVTDFSVITAEDEKIVIVDEYLRPDVAILDSTCISNVPQKVLVDTGLDVLTHATEAYVATNATDFTDALSEKAIKLLFAHLPILFEDSQNYESRDKVHNASCLAGIAFNNAGLGINHSLAHALGGKFGISHGRCNALLLETIIKYNADLEGAATNNAAKKYAQLARLLNLPARTVREGVVSYLDAIQQLKKCLGVEARLSQLAIDEATYSTEIQSMATTAMKDRCTATNPVQPTQKALEKIYQNLY